MPDIAMPRLSDSMEEGTIVRWLKNDGDSVKRGEPIVEIESDKATMEYEADSDGFLHIIAHAEATLAIGEPIAQILKTAADSSAPGQPASQQVTPQPETTQPQTDQQPAPPKEDLPAASQPQQTEVRVHASPVARRVALENGIDLATVNGSGPEGRIVRSDVEMLIPTPTTPPIEQDVQQPAASSTNQESLTAKGSPTHEKLSRTQSTIARRMAQSKATIPDFSVHVEIDMERCVELRSELRELNEQQPLPSYNDMLVKACALALTEHPRVNGCYQDEKFVLHERVNIGVAVAGKDTLVVPTITDANTASLREISQRTKELATRVREGTITPPQVSGTTFTISNLGMLGVRSFNAIITPGQSAILTVGSIEQRPVCVEGTIVAHHTMALTLTCDHRILYGADAAAFLTRVRVLLEHPAGLLT